MTKSALLLFGTVVQALAGEPTVQELLDRRYALERGERAWRDRTQRIELRTSTVPDRVVELEMFDKRRSDGTTRTLVRLVAPPELGGRAYVAWGYPDRAPAVKFYAPGTRRLRSLSSHAAWEGLEESDVTCGDLDLLDKALLWGPQHVRATEVGREQVDGVSTRIIDLQPNDDRFAAEHFKVWLAESDLVARRIEMFKKGAAVPRRRIQQRHIEWEGRRPVAREIEIETPADGDRVASRTVLRVREVAFDTKLQDDIFLEEGLQRDDPVSSSARGPTSSIGEAGKPDGDPGRAHDGEHAMPPSQ